ncbi:hypothetical protein [Mycobacterium sp. E136]|nr:hypothetical protein [Mycobacterium sp. E136]
MFDLSRIAIAAAVGALGISAVVTAARRVRCDRRRLDRVLLPEHESLIG